MDTEKKPTKRHRCFNCGADMGEWDARYCDYRDTYGAQECERERRNAEYEECEEAHEQLNRDISEPPSHRECAEFAVKACPFLANPRMRRNEKNLPDHGEIPGIHLDRNPGVTCLWETRDYKPFRPHNGGVLFKLGEPTRVDWYALGKPATRDQVVSSIDGGYPELERLAREDGPNAIWKLTEARARAMAYLPTQS